MPSPETRKTKLSFFLNPDATQEIFPIDLNNKQYGRLKNRDKEIEAAKTAEEAVNIIMEHPEMKRLAKLVENQYEYIIHEATPDYYKGDLDLQEEVFDAKEQRAKDKAENKNNTDTIEQRVSDEGTKRIKIFNDIDIDNIDTISGLDLFNSDLFFELPWVKAIVAKYGDVKGNDNLKKEIKDHFLVYVLKGKLREINIGNLPFSLRPTGFFNHDAKNASEITSYFAILQKHNRASHEHKMLL